MRKPIPWSTRGNGGDLREAARAAARRDGMSAAEWTAQAIGHYAAQVGVDPSDLNDEERSDALVARLRQTASPRMGESALPNVRPRPPRVEGWLGRDERSRTPAARAGSAEADVDFKRLAHRLDHLEAELTQGSRPDALQPIRGALARLEARLDSFADTAVPPRSSKRAAASGFAHDEDVHRVESKVNSLIASLASSVALPDTPRGSPATASASSLPRRPSLGGAIAEITRHQRMLEETARSATAEVRSSKLEEPASSADDRSATTRAMAGDAGDGGGATLESLHSDIAALAGKVEEVRREQAERYAAPPVCNLDKLRAEIATMSDALRDLASRGSVAPLEAAIRNLTEQIELSRSDGAREALLQPLERLVGDLRMALAEVDPRTTIRGLEGEVRKLGGKLDDLGRCSFDATALGDLDTRTRQIQETLSTAVPAHYAPIVRIERNLEALAERFDRLPLGEVPRDAAIPESSDLQAVADELRRVMGEEGRVTLGKIEAQLEEIAARVEEALSEARDETRYTALANRIDDVHRELTGRLSQAPAQLDTHVLEELIRGLAEKMEEARSPQDDGRAIEALQKQVSEFAERLDRTAASFPSLTSLEHAIGELFTELERTHEISSVAAEKAARSVLDEMLGKTNSFDSIEAARDLAELRMIQDEAGRRTFATLNAVHETLEKVVDRLAMVETEIAEVRFERPAELLAAGAAPAFARAATREFHPSQAVAPKVAARSERTSQGLGGEAAKPDQRNDSLDDFLIEPGRGFPGRREAGGNEASERKQTGKPSDLSDLSEAGSGRAGFIAAARRAAQAAQMESSAVLSRDMSRPGSTPGAHSANLIEQTRNFIVHHKRPVVLSIAALFLAMGAYAVVKTVGHAPANLSFGVSKDAPAAQSRMAHRASAPLAALASSPSKLAAPAGSVKGASPSIPGSDPIVTGSIGAAPKITAPATPVPELSLAQMQQLARSGNAKAQYLLANAYASGTDVPRDPQREAQWFEKAAAQNLAPAQYRLGSLYEKGTGIQRDLGKAMALYRKAADQGNIRAMHNLAVLTAEGGSDGKPDYSSAAQWFRKAAEYGVRDSQYNLAILLARGLGVSQNLALSYTWFAIAASQGDEDAAKKRDDVGEHLSAADLAAAKATAAAFRARIPTPSANEVAPPQAGPAPSVSTIRLPRPRLAS
jgi:localization factor PodJL